MINSLYYWIDLIWLPVGLLLVTKEQRIWMAAFLISNMIMMRMLAELIESTGYNTGFLPFMTSQAYDRGLVVYSVFYVLFLIIAHYSPNSDKHVFIAASITVFFVASISAVTIMVL